MFIKLSLMDDCSERCRIRKQLLSCAGNVRYKVSDSFNRSTNSKRVEELILPVDNKYSFVQMERRLGHAIIFAYERPFRPLQGTAVAKANVLNLKEKNNERTTA